MHKQKLICLAFAALMPFGSVLAEDAAPAQPEATEAAKPEASQTEAVGSADSTEAAEKPADSRMSMEERWKEREKRYEELKSRAEEAGVMLPESPPWHNREAMMMSHPEMQKRMEHRQKMMSMTPEERDAYRMERYQEMRERAQELGMELPETPPWKDRQIKMEEEWAKQQEVIKGMSDEERAACHAMHRRHLREMEPAPMRQGGGMYPNMPEAPYGYGPGPGRGYGPGYGYGPGPYAPRDYWDPNQ